MEKLEIFTKIARDCGDRLIFASLVGPQAYGDIAKYDTQSVIVVCIPSKEALYLGKVNKTERHQPTKLGEPSIQIMDIRRFADKLIECDIHCIESLFSSTSYVVRGAENLMEALTKEAKSIVNARQLRTAENIYEAAACSTNMLYLSVYDRLLRHFYSTSYDIEDAIKISKQRLIPNPDRYLLWSISSEASFSTENFYEELIEAEDRPIDNDFPLTAFRNNMNAAIIKYLEANV